MMSSVGVDKQAACELSILVVYQTSSGPTDIVCCSDEDDLVRDTTRPLGMSHAPWLSRSSS